MNLDRNNELIRKAEKALHKVVDDYEEYDPELIEIWNNDSDEPLYFDYITFFFDGNRLRHVAAELEVGLVDAAKYVLNSEMRGCNEFDP